MGAGDETAAAPPQDDELLRTVVENSRDAAALVDDRGTILWVSPVVDRLLGWRPADLVGTSCFALVHPDDLRPALAVAADHIDDPGAEPLHLRLRTAEGGWRHAEILGTLLGRDGDRGDRMLLNIRDVTSRIETEHALRQSESLFRSLAQGSPVGIFRQDADGANVYVNERWQEITGLAAEDASGDGWRRVLHPDDAAMLAAAGPGDRRAPLQTELRVVRPDGEVRWVAVRTQPVHDDDGEFLGSVGTMADVTERREALRDTQRLIDIFDATTDLVGIADRTGKLLYVNASARRFFGLPPHGSLEGIDLFSGFVPGPLEQIAEDLGHAIERDGMWYGELEINRHDGEAVPVLAQVLVHTDADGDVEFFSGVLHDISLRKRYESELAHQATHDPLTGLPNRVLLLERLGFALERAADRHTSVAVLFLDLDHFKVVNDSLGHGVGDRLLVAIAERLATVLRPSDTIARFGGDEFVVLCEDLERPDDALAVAERIHDAIAEPMAIEEGEVYVGASIGIAYPGADAEPGGLIRDADAAMYRAKAKGRARWEVFDTAMRAHAVDRLDIENALRRARDRRELRVVYQPVVSLRSGTVVGVEALLRWEHPQRGVLHPADFITVAEETGLIVPIGAWVLDQACRELQRWDAALPGAAALQLSVNLSGRQLAHGGLVESIGELLGETGLDPSRLELEITESVLMDDIDAAVDTLHALKSLGVRLGVDDFGTGYSSLSYLHRFPVDVLKVDRTFVDGLGPEVSDSAIVAAVVTLARSMGLTAVAEGVESREQLDALRSLSCDLAQGFLFASPMSGLDLADFLASQPRW